MNKIKTIATSVALSFSLIGVASAATWTFGDDAELFQDTVGFEGTFDQVYGLVPGAPVSPLSGQNIQDGITLTASAYNPDTTATVTTFMDAESGGKIAGLGVCSTGFDPSVQSVWSGESQCSTQYKTDGGSLPSNTGDDNLVSPEVLVLNFSEVVSITDLVVRDANHNLVNGSLFISTDATFNDPGDIFSFTSGEVQGLTGLFASNVFYFTSDGTSSGQEIYLETLTATSREPGPNPVPLPAAAWLFGSALIGAGIVGRRKKKAA